MGEIERHDAEIFYMDEWLRNHGRSVPMTRNGVILDWEHTSQTFSHDEVQYLTDTGLDLRTFTFAETEAMDSAPPLNWPWHK
jgi:hypothetical protein